jgi:hypothetical protein
MIGFTGRPGSRTTRRLLLAATMGLALGAGACDTLAPLLTIGLATPSVTFRAVRGSTAPLQQTVTITNAGSGRLGPVTCPAQPAAWLSCSVNNGNTVVLTASPAGLTTSPAPVSVPITAEGVSNTVSVEAALLVEQPVIGLSTSSVSFTTAESSSSTSPASATITLSNTGAGDLANLSPVTCTANPASSRIGCQVSSGQLVVTVDPSGLAPGSYLFPVTVSSPNSSVSQTFAVSLTVNANPRIALSPNALFFSAVRGAPGTQSKTVTVSNTGTGSLGTVSCPASPASWLACSVSGSTVTFNVNSSSLTTTPSAVSVPISASGAANSPQSVTVNLQIDQPVLTIENNVSSLSFTAISGEATSTPGFLTFQVANSGAGTINNLGAVTCSAPSGITCSVSPTGQVTVAASGLSNGVARATGVYSIPITISAANSPVSRQVVVVLQVTPAATLVLSSNAANLFSSVGSTTPVSTTLTFSNGAGGDLGTVSCPANPASWLTCSVNNGAQTITFTADPTGLTASPSPVEVAITASNIPGSTEDVLVTFTLGSATLLQLNSNVAAFSANSGATTATPAQVFLQASNSGGALSALGTLTCLSVGSVTCSVDGTGLVTIAVDPTGRTPGSYVFFLQVNSQLGGSQPVTVTLTVS